MKTAKMQEQDLFDSVAGSDFSTPMSMTKSRGKLKARDQDADLPEHDRLIAPTKREDDARFDRLCRPSSLDEYIGQEKHKSNLRVFVEAARRRGEPLDHVLLCGPPGLGKTTLAYILANEMGVQVHTTSGPAIEHKGALAGQLTKLESRDVLFIDEIHRLTASVEETLYPAIESFRLDVMMGDGPHASSIQLDLNPFTLVGATTRTGLLTSPLLSRFGYIVRLDFYPVEELVQIVKRSAMLLNVEIDEKGAKAIAQRSRGTPRVANRLLRRVSDFALVLGNGKVDQTIAREACERLGIDEGGLDEMDRRLLSIIIEAYEGGPVGLDTLAAAMAEPRDTIEDVYEPFMLQQGFLGRTPRGRIATRKAYEHLGIKRPEGKGGSDPQETLF
ncbi:MAG TPA: Holliday junction branch migration DNA helicase RuvB [Polyangiaceae bacterium]|nr:Holliday junction branch migration DNA helicase RuvB [Polyangiaceae bacterium]HOD23808.1 Holliday junction branch migration DNA helicase RuvB [Polyangiaceae bacterium]HOE48765.1 Holliday junction branch migration DNA helicase RuvB [Polyangiaceae bacterium]HOH02175.1 Holliday junction branch migration DNA helicase RuvB [Polyangiaceae bacterium]HOR37998.1 Holliday junction branch migration DNA helicase RuvB [Polyangiaceae bacterium]